MTCLHAVPYPCALIQMLRSLVVVFEVAEEVAGDRDYWRKWVTKGALPMIPALVMSMCHHANILKGGDWRGKSGYPAGM